MKQDAVFSYFAGEGTLEALAKKFETVEEAADLLSRVASVSIGKFQIDALEDPTELMKRSLEIIAGAKLLTGLKVGAAAGDN